MIINHKYKFIFFKTRKTGGTSMEVALSKFCQNGDTITSDFTVNQLDNFKNNNIGESHMTATQLSNYRFNLLLEDNNFFDSYFKFTIIREPVDLFISHFFWLRNKKNERYPTKSYLKDNISSVTETNLSLPANIDDWVKMLKENTHIVKDICSLNFDTYSLHGQPYVDDFITYSKYSGPGSKMYEDCSRISKKLNLPENIADLFFNNRYNTKSRPKGRVLLSQESLDFIEKVSINERNFSGIKLATEKFGGRLVLI